LIVTIALAVLALIAVLLTLAVVAPPRMEPVPIPSVSSA
jgi:hypothetical protein